MRPQATGVVMVAMGKHHPHRQAGDLPHCLRHMALLHTGIDEQSFLLPDNQELTHPVVQNIKLLHKFPDLWHLQTPPHNCFFFIVAQRQRVLQTKTQAAPLRSRTCVFHWGESPRFKRT